ncbi:hypothetical protein [Thermoleophilum album]|uniref:hypothetical protein n=1 Tax=Thermoleophilum album TaxID=29539 RepID=UPI000B89662B|nr:hypothetical protein [Thermoleophilum album]
MEHRVLGGGSGPWWSRSGLPEGTEGIARAEPLRHRPSGGRDRAQHDPDSRPRKDHSAREEHGQRLWAEESEQEEARRRHGWTVDEQGECRCRSQESRRQDLVAGREVAQPIAGADEHQGREYRSR